MIAKKPIYVTSPSLPPYDEYCAEIRDIWESRQLTNSGVKHKKLEAELSEYLGVPNVALFANGHLALELALTAANLSGEVITTPYTFASTTQAIVRCGLTPVFCDIRDDDYTIDTDKIEALITEKTTAIVPVHVYGNVCSVGEIERIASKHGLKVIYDAAHVFGVKYKGAGIGSFGDMSMFSFHATKVFNTVEGGAVTYSDEKYTDILRRLRQFGQQTQESVTDVGINAKMTEMHAAMGLCNLRYTDGEIEKRRAAVTHYRSRLSGKSGIRLCVPREGVTENFAYFPVVFDGYKYSRDEVCKRLEAANIFARKYFYPLTSEFQAYRGRFAVQPTPAAKHISECVLTLPLYAGLADSDVDRICDIICK